MTESLLGARPRAILDPREAGGLPWALAVGVAAFTAHAALAPTTYGERDASELTLAIATAGVPHPTGYPLYVVLGHLFARALHATGLSFARAANLWSALGAAVAMAFAFLLAARLTRLVAPQMPPPRRRLLGLVPVAFLALHPVWVGVATVAEVYSWHLAWVLAFATVSAGALARVEDETWMPTGRAAMGWGALLGLGLAHHLSAVLVALPFAGFLLVRLAARRALSGSLVLQVLIGLALPLASYGFVAWRAFHPAAFQWPELLPSWRSIAAHVTGEQYRYLLGGFAPSPPQQRLLMRAVYPLLALSLLAVVAAAMGARRPGARAAFAALFAAAAIQMVSAFGYSVDDPAPYFLPALGLGLAALPAAACAMAAYRDPDMRRPPGLAIALGLMAVALWIPWTVEAVARRTYHERFDRRVRELWATLPDDSAIVLWADDGFHRLLAYQVLEGERRGLYLEHPVRLVGGPATRRFEERFGFDPAAGLDLRAIARRGGTRDQAVADVVDAIVANVGARSPVPVFRFRASEGKVERVGGGRF